MRVNKLIEAGLVKNKFMICGLTIGAEELCSHVPEVFESCTEGGRIIIKIGSWDVYKNISHTLKQQLVLCWCSPDVDWSGRITLS